jgi:hypothetical protein
MATFRPETAEVNIMDHKPPRKFLVLVRSKGVDKWTRLGAAKTVEEARQLIKDNETEDQMMIILIGRSPKCEYEIWEADWKFIE